MFIDDINRFSDFMTFDRTLIPSFITFIVLVLLNFFMLKGGGITWQVFILYNAVAMAILTLLGVDSIFNFISIIKALVSDTLNDILPFFVILRL